MSDPNNTPAGMCAAYGCPLFGVYGAGGKWFCCCHHNVDGACNDAITMELNMRRDLVDRALNLRRTFQASAAILAAESELIEMTRQVGTQQSIHSAPVVGPTHAAHHFAETDA